MLRKITTTGDGSPTFFVPALNEHYHSMFGAVQESAFVYIDKALRRMNKSEVRVFETGFGTGLNAFLSCREAEEAGKNICYHSIEKYPLDRKEWLEFGKYFEENEAESTLFHRIHECKWEKEEIISPFFRIKKIKADLITYQAYENYDIIFFDAFGPDVQPELWTREIFSKIYGIMKTGAILSTYSSKGQVRRNMQNAGLVAERTPGPPGKRQMILAFKPCK